MTSMLCTFFARDGYCSKGQYCQFSHVQGAQPSICKNFLNANGCRFGSSCAFQHAVKSTHGTRGGGHTLKPASNIDSCRNNGKLSNVASISTVDGVNQSVPIVPRSYDESLERDDVVTESNFVASAYESNAQANWNFDPNEVESSNMDGVYFYGASGTASFLDNKSSESIWNLNSRKGHIAPSSSHRENEIGSKSIKRSHVDHKDVICPFHVNGDCKFGSKCRYQHELGNDYTVGNYDLCDIDSAVDERELKSNVINETRILECNICISQPDKSKGELFGIMSHCKCVFCLNCIREWRNEGLKNPGKVDQIRICPTCRVNSFFVIPSMNVVYGKNKDDLILRYKESLALTPCKVRFSQLVNYLSLTVTINDYNRCVCVNQTK